MPTFREKAAAMLAEIDVTGSLDKRAALITELIGVLRRLDMWQADQSPDRVLFLLLALCDIESGTFSIDELVDLLEEEQHTRGL